MFNTFLSVDSVLYEDTFLWFFSTEKAFLRARNCHRTLEHISDHDIFGASDFGFSLRVFMFFFSIDRYSKNDIAKVEVAKINFVRVATTLRVCLCVSFVGRLCAVRRATQKPKLSISSTIGPRRVPIFIRQAWKKKHWTYNYLYLTRRTTRL